MLHVAAESLTARRERRQLVEHIGLVRSDDVTDTVLTGSPVAARFFAERGMLCVGCPMARFETIAETCAIYGEPLDPFLDDLNADLSGRPRPASSGRRQPVAHGHHKT
jgi:hybrid cluster-associated redox disulfide protein